MCVYLYRSVSVKCDYLCSSSLTNGEALSFILKCSLHVVPLVFLERVCFYASVSSFFSLNLCIGFVNDLVIGSLSFCVCILYECVCLCVYSL